MQENGQLLTCDRCGKAAFFRCTGEGELDGGYTRWNEFEEAKGWSYEGCIGDLCPTCTNEFKAMKENFKRYVVED